MTTFLLSLGWNWLLVPVAIWFLNGLRKALLNPRLRYRAHTKVGSSGYFLDVTRQELLPPWRLVDETWWIRPASFLSETLVQREGDGKTADWLDIDGLHRRLSGCLNVARARDTETEELSK